MSIVRVQKRDPGFVQIDKEPLENEDLSWKAKGLLAYLLTRPDDWQVRPSHLQTISDDGRDATYSGLQELHEAGHIEKRQIRDKNGHFDGTEYVVFEVPRDTENPDTENPDTDSPDTENPSPTNKESTKKEGTNREDKGSGSPSASARGDGYPSGDSLPDVEVDVDTSLEFLPAEYDVYEPAIQGYIDEYGPDTFDQLLKRSWGNVSFSWSSGARMARDVPWDVFVAAVVIAGNEAERPNLRYLNTIIDGLQNPTPTDERHDTQQKRPSQSGAPAGRGGQWGDYA